MKRYEDFIDGLKQNVEIPDKVWFDFDDTLNTIDKHTVKRNRWKTTVKAAVIAGVALIGGGVFCINNPVVAAKIPIIGNIFKQVENDVEFSGNYAGDKGVQNVVETKDTKTGEKGVVTAESNGVKITASEIYNDGYSIYLTMQIEMENGPFTHVPSVASSRFGETDSQGLYTEGTWKTSNMNQEMELCNNMIEGKAQNDNAFIGMIKLDAESYSAKDGKLILDFTEIGYDDDRDLSALEPYKVINGEWKLEIPYTTDMSNCKEIVVNKKNEDGFGVEKVFVSPYQVIVFKQAPLTEESENPMSEEAFNKKYGKKNNEAIGNGDAPYTYEEYLADKQYEYTELAIYNDKGEYLEYSNSEMGNNVEVFSVKEKDTSKLHIYMGDETHMFEMVKTTKEKKAAAISIFDVTIDTE